MLIHLSNFMVESCLKTLILLINKFKFLSKLNLFQIENLYIKVWSYEWEW